MLRALLISLMILGCFASFAQNAWGNTLRMAMVLSLGILFLWEFFVSIYKNKFKVRGLAGFLNQCERLAFFVLCLAELWRFQRWFLTGLVYLIAIFLLVVCQLIRTGYWPFCLHISAKMRAVSSAIAIATMVSASGFVFKKLHWPYANMLLVAGAIITLTCTLLLLIAMYSRNEKLFDFKLIRIHHPNGIFYLLFLGGWAAFMTLQLQFTGMPNFYDNHYPNSVYEYLENGNNSKGETAEKMMWFTNDNLWPAIREAEKSWYSEETAEEENPTKP